MTNFRGSAATARLRKHIVLVDFLKKQMLDLEILHEKVAEAELRCTKPKSEYLYGSQETTTKY